jgi:glycosyltransferase involved in cell wall biosynthesis
MASSSRSDAGSVPAAVLDAAQHRADARAVRDWDTADRLRDEIEGAGWRVIDAGTDFRLEPATPADVEVGGEIRYGRTDSVPSLLEEAPTGFATVIVVASPDVLETREAVERLGTVAPPGVDVVVVADGLRSKTLKALEGVEGAEQLAALDGPGGGVPVEIVRTSETLGQAAALNIGIRRSRAPVVVVLDPSIKVRGDVITSLVAALADPAIAVAGPLGLVSDDLRHFDEIVAPGSTPVDAAAIQGYLMAFRRADAAARGPLDEAFRFYRNLDVWWSLVLRDEGEGRLPRHALVVPALPLERAEPHAWRTTPPAERDRLSKRNFYRLLDRFRTRLDLAVPLSG